MTGIGAILGLVGLVWGAILLGRGGLLAGCLVVLVSGICLSVPFWKSQLGPVPLSVDRLLFVVLVVQYVVWRRWGWAEAKPIGPPEWLLVAMAGYMVLSTFRAEFTASNYQPVAWLAIYYLMPVGLYWIARNTRLAEPELRSLWGCLALLGIYLAVVSIAERYELWALVVPRYIATTAAENKMEFIGRARGPLLHPIGNGMWLATCLAAALLAWPRWGRAGRSALVVAAALMLVAMYCTLTRSVWMGAALVVAILLAAGLPRAWRVVVFGGGALLVAALAVPHWEQLVGFKRDRGLSARETAESVYLRPVLARIAWNMFLDRPLLGCGYHQYPTEHLAYTADRTIDLPLEKGRGYVQHNVFLALLAETGLVGLGLFVALLALWSRDAWRLWRRGSLPLAYRQQGLLLLAAVGVYVVNGMFHDVSCIPMANMMVFFLAGVTEALRPRATASSTWAGAGRAADRAAERSAALAPPTARGVPAAVGPSIPLEATVETQPRA